MNSVKFEENKITVPNFACTYVGNYSYILKFFTFFQAKIEVQNISFLRQTSPGNNKMFMYIMLMNVKVRSHNCLYSDTQECYARKVNCSRVYSAHILKPVLFGRNL